MKYLLGIDVSTTAVKALLIDERGEVAANASQTHPLHTPHPLWCEQDPADWWRGVTIAVPQALEQAGVAAEQVAAVGLTGQMHGLVMIDRAGDVLRPAILWNDQRCGEQCEQIRREFGRDRLIQTTGNDALAGFTLPKLLWVRNHEPDKINSLARIVLPKDYLRLKMTGDFAVDCADAAGTLMLDLRTRNWSASLLDAFEIARGWLPTVYEGDQITGVINGQAADALGLKAGTPVVAGGGDQAAQAIGAGAVQPGVMTITLGTSGVVFAGAEAPIIEPQARLHSFCHAVPGRWHLMGVMLCAAGALQWYRDQLNPGTSFDDLVREAEQAPPGCDGLLFAPYLTGERTPHPDPLARGAFVGLTARHRRAHLTRAVLEGVAFGLRDNYELMRSAGLTLQGAVRLSGGGAVSALWRQIIADVLNRELITLRVNEGAAYGAALLAGVGVGVWPDVDAACRSCISLTESVTPDPDRTSIHQQYYNHYRKVYPTLRTLHHDLHHVSDVMGG